MPKKKIPHKGKPNCATDKSEGTFINKTTTEDPEEEYITVAEYETNKKYSKRPITNNWAKYESDLPKFEFVEEDEVEFNKTDFDFLLKNASSDASHFQFASEKQWKEDDCSITSSDIFNLDLKVLSSGLACLPFYKRIGLSESELSDKDKESFDEAAAENWKEYERIIKSKSSKSDLDDEGRTLEKVVEVTENVSNECSSEVEKEGIDENVENIVQSLEVSGINDEDKGVEKDMKNDKVPKCVQKVYFSENDENLEDWLDSVLDD